MSKFVIDFDAWTTVEAENESQAYAIGETIINQIHQLVSNQMTLAEPLKMEIGDGGVEREI